MTFKMKILCFGVKDVIIRSPSNKNPKNVIVFNDFFFFLLYR